MKCKQCGTEMTFGSALKQLDPFRFKCSNCKTKYRAILPYLKIRTLLFCLLFLLLGFSLVSGIGAFGVRFLALVLLLTIAIGVAVKFALYRATLQSGELVPVQPGDRKIARIFGMVLIGLILVGLISYTAFSVYAHIELQKEIKRKRENGQPVTLSDLATPKIPESQNAIPLYREATQRLEQHRDPLNFIYTQVGNQDFSQWPPEEQETIRTILAEHDQTFEMIHEAALRPEYWIDVVEFWQNQDFVSHGRLQFLTKLLALKAALDKADGDIEGAIDRSLDGLRVGQAATTTRGLMGSLIHFACSRITLNQLEMLLDDAEVSKETYQRLYTALEQQRESLRMDFPGESALSFNMFQEWMAGESYLKRPFIKLQFVLNLRVFSEYAPQENQPYWEWKPLEYDKLPWYAKLPWIGAGIPIYSNFSEGLIELRARYHAAQLAIALRQYRIKHQTYPQSLEDLVGEVVTTIPTDPFTGEAFHYQREENGFVIYSVGRNGVDDGGLLKDDGGRWRPNTPYEFQDVGWRFRH
jgi:hypothetical protein